MTKTAFTAKPLRVCIVGAGASGLTSARQILKQGFDPVIFEMSPVIGGLWAYHEEDVDGRPSIMRSTVTNSSKEMNAFSDFPPPKDMANFMPHKEMLRYFQAYADRFKLTSCIRFKHEVLLITPAADYDTTGRWDVLVKDVSSGKELLESFDAVMICSGHHAYPHIPTFRGQEKFKGTITHTHSLKVPDKFRDRRVAVVGIGDSGVDAVVNVSHVASQAYLSTRRGAWIAGRMGPNSMPVDITFLTRFSHYMDQLLPTWVVNDMTESLVEQNFNHDLLGLRPKHRFSAQHPTVNDDIANSILNGTVRVKTDIKEFTEDGVLFEGDREVTILDDVILATGYQIKFPFLPEDVVSIVDNEVQLYKYVFPPSLKHPTLAMIGLVQPIGSTFPVSELQARWMAQVLAGNRKLPTEADMYEEISRTRDTLRKRYVNSPRHTIQVDYIDYMDELADQIGAKPNMLKYFFTDPVLFQALLGPCVSYQYRLQGPHPWSGARDAILGAKARVLYPLNSRFTHFQTKWCSTLLQISIGAFVVFSSYLLFNRF